MRYGAMALGAMMAVAMLTTGARATQIAPFASYLARAELAPLSKPASSLPFSFSAQAGEDGTLALTLDDDAAGTFTDEPLQRYLLRVQPKDASHQIRVRHRTLIYMNIGDEGPHHAIPATEQRGPWQPAIARPGGAFEVGGLPEPTLKLTRAQLLAAVKGSEVGRDERWLALARQCKAPDQGPCYTVIDTEYEVTIGKRGRTLARGVLRVRQPNGC